MTELAPQITEDQRVATGDLPMACQVSDDISRLTICDSVIWPGLSAAPPYHPLCHWPELCKARGCFWRWPQAGFRQQPNQRGLDL